MHTEATLVLMNGGAIRAVLRTFGIMVERHVMGFLDYIMDTSKLGPKKYRKLLFYLLLLFIIATILTFMVDKLFFVFIFFGISFGATLAIVLTMGILYAIVWSVYMIFHYRGLWIRSMFRTSIRERSRASRQIGILEDPFLDKIFTWWHKAGMFLFKMWLVVFVLVVFGYFVWLYLWPHS